MEGGKCGSPTARVKVAKEKRGLVDRRESARSGRAAIRRRLVSR
jgi:hypothetical protein